MPDDKRTAGPPPATSVRRAGDPLLAQALADALVFTGRVERATHGFHTYPAGMHPDMARLVLEHCPGPVHDPFCGGGTVLVEALLAGRPASGTDLSPIAVLVSRARTAGPEAATPLRAASRRLTAAARLRVDVDVPAICVEWYEPHVAQELGRLRDGIEGELPEVRPLLWAVFSAIAVKASFRESDTSNRRVPGHRAPGTTAVLFHKKARELGRMLEELPAESTRLARVRQADAREVSAPEGTGVVLTSPPYPGVYDYLPMQQLRLAWMEIEASSSMAQEIGARRLFRAEGRGDAFRHWRHDTATWINTQVRGLARGSRIVIAVGDGLVGSRMVDALAPTSEAMQAAGLRIVARASADRPDHARDAVRTEHLVMGER